MRRPHSFITALAGLILALVVTQFAGLTAPRAWADDPRLEARSHYQAGQKLYASGDYKAAIKEFSAAQAIAPADLNSYNLALCYDKLGDAPPAIQYYREYLNKVPNADKRAEIEASVSRLDAAVKSADAKRADETRKADEAKQVAAAEDARRADEAKKLEDAKRAAAATEPERVASVPAAPVGPSVGVSAIGTPRTGQIVSTGDAQLDRMQNVDIGALREQRVGTASSGMPDARAAAIAPNGGAGQQQQVNGAAPVNPNAQAPRNGAPPVGLAVNDQPAAPVEQPIYKKWWFWAVVGVSAYVLIEIASDGSSSSNSARTTRDLPLNSTHAVHAIGPTLFRF